MEEKINYTKAMKLICKSRYILVVTHMNPDVDTISSALALSSYFYENKIKHKVFNKHKKQLGTNLDFLDKFDKITDQLPKFYDLIIYIDCANKSRVGIEFPKDISIINIDHHKSNDNFGIINIVKEDYASTAEVVYEFFCENKVTISKQVAQCLYAGIYDDTIGFSTPRCDAKTFKVANELVETGITPNKIADDLLRRDSLAKYRLLPKVLESLELHYEGRVATTYVKNEWLEQTGSSYLECKSIASMILNIAVVDISIFFRVTDGKTKVSLRSKNGIQILKIAQSLNGGGHSMAAGCTCNTDDIDEAKSMVLNFLK
jgi:phosphoesterase RecJ-like protein